MSRSSAPRFHAATKKARIELYQAYGLFYGAYREAAEKLRNGIRQVAFPEGSFPPPTAFADT